MGIVKYKRFIGLSLFGLIGTSCASVHSSFVKEISVLTVAKKDKDTVEFLTQKPQKSAFRIGKISTNGNGFAGFDDLVKEAKEKAAEIGGNFILSENSGVDSKTIYSPGYSSYQAEASSSYGTRGGYGNGQAHGYSRGPSISTVDRPWGVFSVWIYTPSQLGIRLDNLIVSGFHLNSDAGKNGVKIGDILLGVDDYDIQDEGLIQHHMNIHPGDKVKLSLQRGLKIVECQITALPN
ncbi:MAG: S1C family serine protease [Chlamydiota bacterium]